jgi:hypothetical protein
VITSEFTIYFVLDWSFIVIKKIKDKKYAGTKMYRHIGKTGCGSAFI